MVCMRDVYLSHGWLIGYNEQICFLVDVTVWQYRCYR